MSDFQCFLIIGDGNSQLSALGKIADDLQINISKPSVDISQVEPEEKTGLTGERHITIDQVRHLKRHLFQKPLQLPKKIIIIKNAQRLTPEAQNALLKILEEPPKHAVIIMLSSDKKSLLPTIISRVITVKTKQNTKKYKQTSLLLEKNELKILEETSEIDNPKEWLDNQMLSLYQDLTARVKSQRFDDLSKLTSIIERCAYTKKLIEANVNAKFAILDLVFSASKI